LVKGRGVVQVRAVGRARPAWHRCHRCVFASSFTWRIFGCLRGHTHGTCTTFRCAKPLRRIYLLFTLARNCYCHTQATTHQPQPRLPEPHEPPPHQPPWHPRCSCFSFSLLIPPPPPPSHTHTHTHTHTHRTGQSGRGLWRFACVRGALRFARSLRCASRLW
jgi:hypothetical protein